MKGFLIFDGWYAHIVEIISCQINKPEMVIFSFYMFFFFEPVKSVNRVGII